ncbi:lipid A ethanolaminephosphotransferase [Sinobacterium caligoides]|uniref:Lipid A ethanolaminephosphotransferase n=1 Tax=Sinobacterium caligoides TaxID=933926 RepID=A0A3N2DPI9_9GAMM|nr:phosphoethanolamine--lipid A transferase [Sinobacterium caligoides]ROS01713.1 lipid A ethanolaminephosphotransferase [Sinobacterium caligoides]
MKKPTIKSVYLTALIALFFTLVLNYPLSFKLYHILTESGEMNVGIALALAAVFFALFNLLFTLLSWPYIFKPFFVVLILLSAAAAYSMYFYGVVYDWRMIETMTETNSAEASSYLNSSFIFWLLVTGIVPSLLLSWVGIRYQSVFKELAYKLLSVTLSLVIIGGVYCFYAIDVAAIARNNHTLDQDIVPYYFIKGASKYVNKRYLSTPPEFETIADDAVLHPTEKPTLVVVVVGETARADHFPANGYERMTTPNMISNNMISLQNVASCGTLTAVSVPCMFSVMTRENQDEKKVRYQQNAVDILADAGVGVQWNENDEGCKGVCDRVPTWTATKENSSEFCQGPVCLDESLIAHFDRDVATVMKQRQAGAIFIHTQGSHGPTYYQRYNEATRTFQPDCQRSDIQNCEHQALINNYDNTLVYTDYVVGKLLDKLKSYQQQYNVALMYVSDHGESLGENGMYLHGAPYFMAPKEQTHVPWMTWMSPSFYRDNHLDEACLRRHAETESYSHDNWFHSILGLMNVSTKVYQPSMDFFAACRTDDS